MDRSQTLPVRVVNHVVLDIDLPDGNPVLEGAYRGPISLGVYTVGNRYILVVAQGNTPVSWNTSQVPEPDGECIFPDYDAAWKGVINLQVKLERYLEKI